MKQKTVILTTIMLVMISLGGYAQTSNKDEMVKKVFATLKNKDEEAFVKLFPDAVTLKNFFFGSVVSDTSMTEKDKAGMQAFMDMMSDSSLEMEYRRDFKKYITKGEKKGVDWAQARFISYTADSLREEEDDMKITTLKGKMYFNVNEKEFFLEFSEIIWFDKKGWYGVTIKRVDEKSNESIADMSEMEELISADSADMANSLLDSVAVPSKPKAVQKPKAKQPVKPKAKPKTQTPAKKPE